MARIAVMGAGSWGTTMAKVCAEAGNQVTLWARRADAADLIARTHRNDRYLPGIDLPSNLAVTHDDAAALHNAEIIILGVPSSTVRTNLARWADIIDPRATARTASADIPITARNASADIPTTARTVSADIPITANAGTGDSTADVPGTPSDAAPSSAASVAVDGTATPRKPVASSLWGGATTLAATTDKPLLVSLAKGLEKSTLLRMSQVMAEVTGWPADNLAVLTGPNLAKEIAQQQPAATVVACENLDVARFIQDAIATPYFRPYTNTDVVGCEIAGVSKNVIALAAGMASGRGLGHNTAATIITRGLAEATRLGVKLGALERTFSGLAGLGDLVATCSSPLSRNRTFGEHLGQGMTLAEASEACKGQVAEGVSSCTSLVHLARNHGVEVPIAQAVSAVCHDGHDVGESISRLMQRAKKSE